MNKLLFYSMFFSLAGGLFSADSVFEPLWQYQGTWQFTMIVPGSKPVSNKIQNDCAEIGQFFLCQQTVDGKVAALLTFTPSQTKGHYYTQAVLPDGHASGRGELEIQGDRWTYPSQEEENGKTTYYRITNDFSGKDRIHFERSESADGKTWKVLSSGDEVHSSPAGTRPDPRPDKRDAPR
jgi:hypothetical protein